MGSQGQVRHAGRLAAPAQRGPAACVATEMGRSTSVVDLVGRMVVATIPLAAAPHNLALSPDGAVLIASSPGADQVLVLEGRSGSLRSALPLAGGPPAVGFTPDGKQIFVGAERASRLVVIDAATLATAAARGVGGRPHNLVVTPGGRSAWIRAMGSGHLVRLDLSGPPVAERLPLPGAPHDLVAAPGGAALWVTLGDSNLLLRVLPGSRHASVIRMPGKSAHRFRPFLPFVDVVAGAILVLAGILPFTGYMTVLNTYFIRLTPQWLWDRL